MQEKWQRIASLDCLVRQAHAQHSAAIVLCHGFGASADDLAGLASYLDKKGRFTWVFPKAPLSLAFLGYGPEARAWFPIDSQALEAASRTGKAFAWSETQPQGLPEASAALRETLAVLSQNHPKLCLGGFSQGAMVTLDAYLRFPPLGADAGKAHIAALLLFSGTLLAKTFWESRAQMTLACPFFLSHGSSDAVLPLGLAEQLFELLSTAGWTGEKHIFSGGHEIPLAIIQAASGFLEKHLS